MAAATFVGVWLLWPVVAFAGGLGFAPLAGLAALPLILQAVKRFKPRAYMLGLLAFFAFAGISAAWSPAKFDFAKAGFCKIGLLLAAVGVLVSAAGALAPERRQRVVAFAGWALLAQAAIVVVLAVFERQALDLFAPLMPNSGEGVQNISRNAIIMAVAAPPLIAAIFATRGRRFAAPLAIGVLLAEAAVLLLRDVEAGPMAIAAAGVCVLVVRLRPRDGFRILAVGLALLILAAPFAFDWLTHGADATKATTSAGQRLAIWAKAIEVIHAHPVFGGGVSVLREMKQLIGAGMFADQQVIPNHPHNMALQLWAETGGVGAVLFSAAIVMAGWRLPSPRQLGPGGSALAGLIGGATAVAFVSFDLWNEGWWGACGLLAMLCAALVRAPAAEAAIVPPVRTAPENNFNLLRLLFAVSVALYHLTVLSGAVSLSRASPALSVAAELGVQGFFVISGYLVYASLQRSPSLGVYAEKRFRRLYPAYALVILACAFGAILWRWQARENLGAVAQYVGANLVFLNFLKPELPGLYANNPVIEVNGALWTLKIEVLFYFVLPLLAWLIQLSGKYRLVLLAALYVASEAWRMGFTFAPHADAGLANFGRQLPGQLSFFLAGMTCWLLRDRLVWRWWLIAGAVAALLLSFASPWLLPLRAASLGLVVIWLAVGLPRLFDPARFGDLSYGVYIIHFPIIQAVISIGLFRESPGQGAGVSVLVILVTALLLWHLVERPMLRADSAYRRNAPDPLADGQEAPRAV